MLCAPVAIRFHSLDYLQGRRLHNLLQRSQSRGHCGPARGRRDRLEVGVRAVIGQCHLILVGCRIAAHVLLMVERLCRAPSVQLRAWRRIQVLTVLSFQVDQDLLFRLVVHESRPLLVEQLHARGNRCKTWWFLSELALRLLLADELIDLILHIDIVINADVTIAKVYLDAALLQIVLHVPGLLRVQQDGTIRICTRSNGSGAHTFEGRVMSGADAVSLVGIVTMMSNCHRGVTTIIIEVVDRCTAPHEHIRIDRNHGW